MTTTQFTLNVGGNPGYGHDNGVAGALGVASRCWQNVAQEVANRTGIHVGAVACPAKTLYSEMHGCPYGGEDTVTLQGLRNTQFCQDDELWRECVREIAERMRVVLEQKTAYLSFHLVEFTYLKDKE